MDVQNLRLKYAAISLYTKRVSRWKRNSYPYLSVDSFVDLADCVFNPERFRGKKPTLAKIRDAKVLFVPSLDLVDFLDEYKSDISAKVLIAGNSDVEFHQPLDLPSSVKLVLLQNSYISDGERIQTLPIGLENFKLGLNGNPKFITPMSACIQQNSILFGPFSPTHPDRTRIINRLNSQAGSWVVQSESLSPNEYNMLSSHHKFIACVRGNGVDTHRLWETLYRARIPIVKKDFWSRSLENLNLPIIQIEEWNTEHMNDLINKFQSDFHPKNLNSLWMPYWISKIRNAL
jgi:hypothetical protein